ncbi:nucleotide sugar dehydrogenase [Gammaproteobacteria bacterium]|nr:nucleotide sugar dehydrogenase [Gammaproteobacteria bacterium]
MHSKKITIVGAGFVGTSLSVILSKYHDVKILEVDEKKINLINKKKSPIDETGINDYIRQNSLKLSATSSKNKAFEDADFIIIAIPTDFIESLNSFDTTGLEQVIKDVNFINSKATIIIKSTIPIGFTEMQNLLYEKNNIIFSPEFLREGSALKDNLNPSRIIFGGEEQSLGKMQEFALILKDCTINGDVEILFMKSSEAEAVKLFSNTYLAMRVSFFNELDSFAMNNELDSLKIISGVSGDKRIGNFYNNPSFGYGGYCLPKDTKQLLSNFEGTQQNLIKSIIESNAVRKDFITNKIKDLAPNIVGIYRLVMKEGSSNYRNSAILDIITMLKDKGIKVIIFEPLIEDASFLDCDVLSELESFKSLSSIILANRDHEDLQDVSKKLFTRDIFNKDS